MKKHVNGSKELKSLVRLALVPSLLIAGTALAGVTERVSVANNGTQASNFSYGAAISSTGRYIAFASNAPNLVAHDINGTTDIFVRDLVDDTTVRVSVASDGSESDLLGANTRPLISGNGRYIVFSSRASNLVWFDMNGLEDVFVHDRVTHVTERVNLSTNGQEAILDSTGQAISDDGRYIVFSTRADNLVSGDLNSTDDVFVRDRLTGVTARVSVAINGAEANGGSSAYGISGDGRYVVFRSDATNLVANDTNSLTDVFVKDRVTGMIKRANVASDGTQANQDSGWASISSDGRYVAFGSSATNLVSGDVPGYDVYVHDLLTGNTERIAAGNWPFLSADGRYVAFTSGDSSLVPGDTNYVNDIFVRDRKLGTTERLSVADDGSQANGNGTTPFAITPNGQSVVFVNSATNLVNGDTNGQDDIFVRSVCRLP